MALSLGKAFTAIKESNTPRCWHLKKLVSSRKAQLSTLIWNRVVTEEVANALLPAAML
jgi:hypothetical protein